MCVDPPPQLRPEEKPSEQELAELALRLLRGMAADDPVLAERMRRRGLDPSPACEAGQSLRAAG
jgi:hypothetical protein